MDDDSDDTKWFRKSVKTGGIVGGIVGCFWGCAFTCLMTFILRSKEIAVVSELTGFAYWLNAAALTVVLILGGAVGGGALGIAAGKATDGLRSSGVVVKFAGAIGGFVGVFFIVPMIVFITGYNVDL